MKITKFVHSCLIAEANGGRILVDPGNFSWQSSIITLDLLAGLNFVVVTHAHPDHLHEEFAKAIQKASPDAKWYGPSEVALQLKDWGIDCFTASVDDNIRLIQSDHADLHPWFKHQPEHMSFLLLNELLIGGDCHSLTDSYGARIFGAAINGGPWGAVVGFTRMIESMTNRPEIVIPLHDWHLNEEARRGIYARLPEVLSDFDVEFVGLENGVTKGI